MGGAPPKIGDKPGDVLAVEARGLGRGQVPGDDDGVVGDLREGRGGLAAELAEQARAMTRWLLLQTSVMAALYEDDWFNAVHSAFVSEARPCGAARYASCMQN